MSEEEKSTKRQLEDAGDDAGAPPSKVAKLDGDNGGVSSETVAAAGFNIDTNEVSPSETEGSAAEKNDGAAAENSSRETSEAPPTDAVPGSVSADATAPAESNAAAVSSEATAGEAPSEALVGVAAETAAEPAALTEPSAGVGNIAPENSAPQISAAAPPAVDPRLAAAPAQVRAAQVAAPVENPPAREVPANVAVGGLPPGVPGYTPGAAASTRAATESPAPAAVVNPDAIVEEREEVSPMYVGRVIGKGGEMIRDLQARSGCRIDVDQNVPHGMPRIITYRGTRKTVDFGKQLVKLLCTDSGNDPNVLPLGSAQRKHLVVPANVIGKIIGRGGEMIRELQAKSQAKIQVDHSGSGGVDPNHRQVTVTGTELAVRKAEEMILFLAANPMMDAMSAVGMLIEEKNAGGVWGSGPPYPNMPNGGQNMQTTNRYGSGGFQQQGGGGQYGGQQNHYGGSSETEMFPCPKMYMGRVIGQKGVTINDLQRRSGCDIQVNQDVLPGQDCQISIRGSRQGIETAKQMLREIIESGPSHHYAGGGPQYGRQQMDGYQAPQAAGGYQQQPQQAYQYQAPVVQQQGYAAPYGQQQQPYQQQPAYGGHQPQQQQHVAPYQQQQQQPPQQYGTAPAQQQQAPYGGGGYHQPAQASPWKTATAGDGQVYYYNEKTGETQWDKPAGML